MYTVELILPPREVIQQAIEQRNSDVLQYCSMLARNEQRHLREFCSSSQLLVGLSDHLNNIRVSESWLQGGLDSRSALGPVLRQVPANPAFAQLEIILRRCSLMIMLPHPDVILLALQQLGMIYTPNLVMQVMKAVATLIDMMMASVQARLPAAMSMPLPPISPISMSTPILTLPAEASRTVLEMQEQIRAWFKTGVVNSDGTAHSTNNYQPPKMEYKMPARSRSPREYSTQSKSRRSRREDDTDNHHHHYHHHHHHRQSRSRQQPAQPDSKHHHVPREQTKPDRYDKNEKKQHTNDRRYPGSTGLKPQSSDSKENVIRSSDQPRRSNDESESDTTEDKDVSLDARRQINRDQRAQDNIGQILRMSKRRPGLEHMPGQMLRVVMDTQEEKVRLDPRHEASVVSERPSSVVQMFVPLDPTDNSLVAEYVDRLVAESMRGIQDDTLIHSMSDRMLERIAVADSPALKAIEQTDIMGYTPSDLLVRWETGIWKNDYAQSLVDTVIHAIESNEMKTTLQRDDLYQIAEIEKNKIALLAAPLLLEMTPLKVKQRMENHLEGVEIPPRFNRSIERKYVIDALITQARRTYRSYIGVSYPASVDERDGWPGDGYLPAPASWKAHAAEFKLPTVRDALYNYLANFDVWTMSEKAMHDTTAYLAFPGTLLTTTDAMEGNEKQGRILMPEKPLYTMSSVPMGPYVFGGKIPVGPPPGYVPSKKGNENLLRQYATLLQPTEVAVLKYDNEGEALKRQQAEKEAAEEKKRSKDAAIKRSVAESLMTDPVVTANPRTTPHHTQEDIIREKINETFSVDASPSFSAQSSSPPMRSEPAAAPVLQQQASSSETAPSSNRATSSSSSETTNKQAQEPYVYPSNNPGPSRVSTHVPHTKVPFQEIKPVVIETYVDHPNPEAANQEIAKLTGTLAGVRKLRNQQQEHLDQLTATLIDLQQRAEKNPSADLRKQIAEAKERVTAAKAGFDRLSEQRDRLINRIKALTAELVPKVRQSNASAMPPKPSTEYKEMVLDPDMPLPDTDSKTAGASSESKASREPQPDTFPWGSASDESFFARYKQFFPYATDSTPSSQEVPPEIKEQIRILQQEIDDYLQDLEPLRKRANQLMVVIQSTDVQLSGMRTIPVSYRGDDWYTKRSRLERIFNDSNKEYDRIKAERDPLEQKLEEAERQLRYLQQPRTNRFFFGSNRTSANNSSTSKPTASTPPSTTHSSKPAAAPFVSTSTTSNSPKPPQASAEAPPMSDQPSTTKPVAPQAPAATFTAPSQVPVATSASTPPTPVSTPMNVKPAGSENRPKVSNQPNNPVRKSALKTSSTSTERLFKNSPATVNFDSSTKQSVEEEENPRLGDLRRRAKKLRETIERERKTLEKAHKFFTDLHSELNRYLKLKSDSSKDMIRKLRLQLKTAEDEFFAQEARVMNLTNDLTSTETALTSLENAINEQKKSSSKQKV